MRPDLDPTAGVAETVQDLRAQVLDPDGVEAAILVCAYATEAIAVHGALRGGLRVPGGRSSRSGRPSAATRRR